MSTKEEVWSDEVKSLVIILFFFHVPYPCNLVTITAWRVIITAHIVSEMDYKVVLKKKKELQGDFNFSRSFCFDFEAYTELRDGRFSFTHPLSIL